MNRIITFVLAAAIVAGCSAQQPGGGGIEPGQQCALLRTLTSTAQTGVLLAKIKDDTARMAVNAALSGVEAGADDYCSAVERGEAPDGLTTLLKAFNAALDDLNKQLLAAQSVATALAFPRGHERVVASAATPEPCLALATDRPCANERALGDLPGCPCPAKRALVGIPDRPAATFLAQRC